MNEATRLFNELCDAYDSRDTERILAAAKASYVRSRVDKEFPVITGRPISDARIAILFAAYLSMDVGTKYELSPNGRDGGLPCGVTSSVAIEDLCKHGVSLREKATRILHEGRDYFSQIGGWSNDSRPST